MSPECGKRSAERGLVANTTGDARPAELPSPPHQQQRGRDGLATPHSAPATPRTPPRVREPRPLVTHGD